METIHADAALTQLASLCHALGHPLRLGIVRYIAHHPRCICNDIVQRTNRAQSTISEHLRVLVQAGVVESEHEGQATVYWLAPQTLRLLEQEVEQLCDSAQQKTVAERAAQRPFWYQLNR
ncbi:ArsR/SmtB family transcription factor [Herpetosiphon llansteffanensis]|uniref:ArsR/SmtB family transcription factor n=1 Tax=Herpetosiphon llansteffanensis TaxID=2094568 RepID=UPI000D7CFCE2|nr:metalloregulator ArsR/SmtB family transcription factor [Herpetosiphon llansteffanensis]